MSLQACEAVSGDGTSCGHRRLRAFAALALSGWAIAGCSEDSSAPTDTQGSAGPGDELSGELADAFRIDVSSVDVTYDWYPDEDRVDGSAMLRFSMRPGQDAPIFHFNPLRGDKEDEREMLRSVVLDGERLDPADDADLRVTRTALGAEPAYELQREVVGDSEHTLEVDFSMPKPFPPNPARPWLFQTFDDTQGPDDEIDSPFPTISSPEELARHTIDLRVHSEDPYVALGSGSTDRLDSGEAGVQAWAIDSGREISSSTMFFAAAPESRLRTRTVDVDGVEIELVSNLGDGDLARAEEIARRSVGDLTRSFGAFPVDHVSVLLTRWGSGMEYYAATRSGLGSLRHELGHMYFGTSLVNRTWRDTWWDEAAVSWWQGHKTLQPVTAEFSRAFGADRPPAAPGFDTGAYGSGAKVFESIARELGGDGELIDLLGRMGAERRFEPFTTEDFIDEVLATDPSIEREQLERWMLERVPAD